MVDVHKFPMDPTDPSVQAITQELEGLIKSLNDNREKRCALIEASKTNTNHAIVALCIQPFRDLLLKDLLIGIGEIRKIMEHHKLDDEMASAMDLGDINPESYDQHPCGGAYATLEQALKTKTSRLDKVKFLRKQVFFDIDAAVICLYYQHYLDSLSATEEILKSLNDKYSPTPLWLYLAIIKDVKWIERFLKMPNGLKILANQIRHLKVEYKSDAPAWYVLKDQRWRGKWEANPVDYLEYCFQCMKIAEKGLTWLYTEGAKEIVNEKLLSVKAFYHSPRAVILYMLQDLLLQTGYSLSDASKQRNFDQLVWQLALVDEEIALCLISVWNKSIFEKKNILNKCKQKEWDELSKLAQAHLSSRVAVAMFPQLNSHLIKELKDENDKPIPKSLPDTRIGSLLKKYNDRDMALTVLRDTQFVAVLLTYPGGAKFIATLQSTHNIQDSELSTVQIVAESKEEVSESDIACLSSPMPYPR
jgi:hypothetical protein